MKRPCPSCNKGELKPVSDIVTELGGRTFIEKGERCSRCKEEFVPEREGQKTIATARRLGLWGRPANYSRKPFKEKYAKYTL